jgi:hypothetical protein
LPLPDARLTATVCSPNQRHRRLLRERGERSSCRAADERVEIAPLHSITSSASEGQIVGDFDAQRPSSALAPLAAPYTESGITNSRLRRYLQRSKPIRTRGESRMTGMKNTSRTDLVAL